MMIDAAKGHVVVSRCRVDHQGVEVARAGWRAGVVCGLGTGVVRAWIGRPART